MENVWQMNWELSFMIKNCCHGQQRTVRYAKSFLRQHDEKPTNSFLYSLVMDTYSMGFASGSVNEMPLNHKIFLAQFDAIKKIAEEDRVYW